MPGKRLNGFKYNVGDKYYYNTVMAHTTMPNIKYNPPAYLLKCICGKERHLARAQFEKGMSKSCGCKKTEMSSTIKGTRKGYYEAIEIISKKTQSGNAPDKIKVRCDCGTIEVIHYSWWLRGRTQHCGCKDIIEGEIWKDVTGFEGLYQISNLGRVKSLPRFFETGSKNIGGVLKKMTIMKPVNSGTTAIKYKRVFFRKEGKRTKFLVHRLVAGEFLGLDHGDKKMYVCHKDDNPENNRVDNLFLGSAKDNFDDMVAKGRHTHIARRTYKKLKGRSSSFYLFELKYNKEVFYKCGVSVNIKQRMSGLKGYGLDVKHLGEKYFKNRLDAINFEEEFINNHKLISYQPNIKFPGYTECFSSLPKSDEVLYYTLG